MIEMTTKYTLYWHIHHDVLCEGTSNIEERIKYIKEYKAAEEIPLRLKLMTPVKNPEKIPVEFIKAQEAYNRAWEAYDRAQEAYHRAREAYIKAWEAYDRAREAYIKAREAYAPGIEKLHKEEHPDCPWNGRTIFSKKVD